MGVEIDGTWTFLTNHAHVLICLRMDASLRVRDLAERVGITERAAHRILTDLIRSGYLTKERDGRRNRYRLHLDRPMRHPLERSVPVRDLIVAVSAGDRGGFGFDDNAHTDVERPDS
jgi:DNA-binding transcriptional ArsR family regulator